MLRNVKALYEVALDELWALLTHFVMNGGKDASHRERMQRKPTPTDRP